MEAVGAAAADEAATVAGADDRNRRRRRRLLRLAAAAAVAVSLCLLLWRARAPEPSRQILGRGQRQQQQQQRQQQQQQRQQQQRRLPQSLIIGARKCGTRALLDFLNLHPKVRAARGEIHYFDDPQKLEMGLAWYRSQMPASFGDELTIEKSPAYFVTEEAPELVRGVNASMRLLLILRDPVTRVVSDYAQHVHRRRSRGLRPKTLERLVLRRRTGAVNPRSKMVRTSLYHLHLRRWLRHFPRRQLHIVDGDLLIRRPHEVLRLAESFLGLPAYIRPGHFVFDDSKGFYCLRQPAGAARCLGRAKGRPHPPVANATVAKLRRFFAQRDRLLANITGHTFSWMRR